VPRGEHETNEIYGHPGQTLGNEKKDWLKENSGSSVKKDDERENISECSNPKRTTRGWCYAKVS